MGPDQVLIGAMEGPLLNGLAANHRSQHLALDFANAVVGGDARDFSDSRFDAHQIRIVAAGLHAEQGPAEWRDVERSSSAADVLECSADGSRQQQPWTSGSS